MGKFTASNAAIIGSKMKGKQGSSFFAEIEKLKRIADEVLNIVEDSIPYDTGNLMDSTGVGVYVNGVLSAFRFDNQATKPQYFHGKEVWGRKTLDEALKLGAGTYVDGVWIVIFSTVPYAGYQDKLSGFFSSVMKSNLKYMVLSQFKLK